MFFSKETELYIDVIQVPVQGASGALHSNCVSLQSDVNIFWYVNSLVAENGFILTIDAAKSSNLLSHSNRESVE